MVVSWVFGFLADEQEIQKKISVGGRSGRNPNYRLNGFYDDVPVAKKSAGFDAENAKKERLVRKSLICHNPFF